MRIVIIFLLSLVSFVSLAQDTTYSGSTKRNTIAVRNELVVYNKLRVPKDTISSAANGSVAYLPGGIYYKDTAWKKIAGTSGGATYTLPTASSTVLGGIKVGARLSIDGAGVLSADVQGGGGGSQTFQQVLTTGSTLSGDNTVTIGTSSNKLRFTTGLLLTDKLVVGNDHSNAIAQNEFYGTNYFAHLQTETNNTGNLFGGSVVINSAATVMGLLRWTQAGTTKANTVNMGFNGDGTDGPKYGELTLNSTLTNNYNGMNLNFDMRGGVHPIRYFGRKYGSASFRSVADWNISENGNTILGSNTEVTGWRLQVTGNTLLTGGLKISNGNPGVDKVWTDTSGNGDGAWRTATGGGGGISGGTADYLARWTGSSAIGIGATRDDGTNVGIGTAPGTYKLNVNGSIGATGTISTRGVTAGFQIHRRDNDAAAFGLLSVNGNLDFYDIAGTTTRMFMTPSGLLKYSADMSGSYDDRTVVDKGYLNSRVLSGTFSYDFPSVDAGGVQSTTVTVPGALVADVAVVNLQNGTHSDYIFTAQVTASNTVTVYVFNPHTGGIDRSSMTFKVLVFKY